jgi:hypothetical protein
MTRSVACCKLSRLSHGGVAVLSMELFELPYCQEENGFKEAA